MRTVALAALFFGLCALSFFFGGSAHETVTFNSPATGSSSGWYLGTGNFYAREGSTLRVEYEATVRRGAFYIAVHQYKPGPHWAGTRQVERSGKGVFDVPLPESGFYWLILDGSPMGNGYDVTYDASWRIR